MFIIKNNLRNKKGRFKSMTHQNVVSISNEWSDYKAFNNENKKTDI